MDKILGIDVGATGIKGAMVDTKTGELVSDRIKLATPKGGKPKEMVPTMHQLIQQLDWEGKPIGVGFPAVILNDIVMTASNIHHSWIGEDIVQLIKNETGSKSVVINDADAAGMAEVKFGNGRDQDGTVILLTLGTGIGSALFNNGVLMQNTELGHLKFKGEPAEKVVSNSARVNREMDWKTYGKELGEYLDHVNFLFSPNLIILGGGISKKCDSYTKYFLDYLNVVPASKQNNAGIIGAAMCYGDLS